ncbi:MAG: hypothetical protein H7832_15150 [Magnetococcus sp. DMHC-6]
MKNQFTIWKRPLTLAVVFSTCVLLTTPTRAEVLFTIPAVATVAAIAAFTGYEYQSQGYAPPDFITRWTSHASPSSCQPVSYQAQPVCQSDNSIATLLPVFSHPQQAETTIYSSAP